MEEEELVTRLVCCCRVASGEAVRDAAGVEVEVGLM